MINRFKKSFKVALIQRERAKHREELLTTKRALFLREIDKGIKETDKSIEEYYKKQSKYITA